MLGMPIIQVKIDKTSIESITPMCNVSVGSYINSVNLRMKSRFAMRSGSSFLVLPIQYTLKIIQDGSCQTFRLDISSMLCDQTANG